MAIYPADLVDWAGNRSGGVRRLFDNDSGRPGGMVLQTNLLHRLDQWASSIVNEEVGTPRIILLVGGPGNGKTEAIESTVRALDNALEASGQLVKQLRESFFPPDGQAVPRLARAKFTSISGREHSISIVQDASTVAGFKEKIAGELLLDELDNLLRGDCHETYLCCVNRGILDDALMEAVDSSRGSVQRLLEAVTASISVSAEAPPCWPLDGFSEVAVWPMDAETLMLRPELGGEAPASSLLDNALEKEKWPMLGQCEAGPVCPFCISRDRLSRHRDKESLLNILRWHEVGSGKRWSFRDLFTLTSYLLAGHRNLPEDAAIEPCQWAARQIRLDDRAKAGARPAKANSSAIFQLFAAQYQHALFHHWDVPAADPLRLAIKDLELGNDNTAMGLQWFLKSKGASYLPAMIANTVDGLSRLLDPAMTNPDCTFILNGGGSISLGELDARFSRSVSAGLELVIELDVLTTLDIEILTRLAKLDDDLARPSARRTRSAAATAVQRFLRDFSCRIARRTIGAMTGLVADRDLLDQFKGVIEDTSGKDLHAVAREVENLLNNDRDFEISLTTTFGQPTPPESSRSTLVVQAQQVYPLALNAIGRPLPPISFLQFGEGKVAKPIPLTYELFKAMKELERGMSPASLPRGVLALLDTAKARLAGPIVRDPRTLDRASLLLGSTGTKIEQRAGVFVRTDRPAL